MRIEKGMLVSTDYIWYVVVEIINYNGKGMVRCICDNANNIYTWDFDQITHHLSLKEIGSHGWANFNETKERLSKDLRERPIPFEVIVEVLSGKHDDRWN